MFNHQFSFRRGVKVLLSAMLLVGFTSCDPDANVISPTGQSTGEFEKDKAQIAALGFDASTVVDRGDSYVVEGDIALKKIHLYLYEPFVQQETPINGRTEHRRHANRVSLQNQRNITVFVDASIPAGPTPLNWRPEVQAAITHLNGIANFRVRFIYVTTAPADITVRSGALPPGVIGEAGPPDPTTENSFNQVLINLNFPLTGGSAQKVYNMVHELGHTIGLMHTNQTAGTLIPGSPATDPASVMNGGTANNTWNGFSAGDRIAFASHYPAMLTTVNGPLEGNNQGMYTWTVASVNGIAPYTYVWRYGTDGINYNGVFGTGASITAPLPQNLSLYLRVTGTASDGEIAIDDFLTTNVPRPKPN